MGSYSYICAASTQVINPGAECRLVILQQGAGYKELTLQGHDGKPVTVSQISNSNTAATSFWEPQSLFLDAIYRDYGRFELAETPATVLALLGLLRNLRYPLVTEKGSHRLDYPFNLNEFLSENCPGFQAARANNQTPSDLTGLLSEVTVLWSYLNDAIPQNRAFAWSPVSRQVRQLALCVIHEAAYLGLVEFTKQFVDYGNFDYLPASFVQRAMAHANESFGQMSEHFSAIEDDAARRLTERFHYQDASFDGLCYAARLDSREMATFRHLVANGQLCTALRDAMTIEERIDSLGPILEMVYAHVALRRLNISFVPLRSCTTDEGVTPGEEFAAYVSRVSSRVVEANEAHLFGPFRCYLASFQSPAQALALQKASTCLDVAMRDVELVELAFDGLAVMSFRLTAELDDARNLLARYVGHVSASTLRSAD